MFTISHNKSVEIHAIDLALSDGAHFVKYLARVRKRKSGFKEKCKGYALMGRFKIWERAFQSTCYQLTWSQHDVLNHCPSLPPYLTHLLCPSKYSVTLPSNHEPQCFIVGWLQGGFSPGLLAPQKTNGIYKWVIYSYWQALEKYLWNTDNLSSTYELHWSHKLQRQEICLNEYF